MPNCVTHQNVSNVCDELIVDGSNNEGSHGHLAKTKDISMVTSEPEETVVSHSKTDLWCCDVCEVFGPEQCQKLNFVDRGNISAKHSEPDTSDIIHISDVRTLSDDSDVETEFCCRLCNEFLTGSGILLPKDPAVNILTPRVSIGPNYEEIESCLTCYISKCFKQLSQTFDEDPTSNSVFICLVCNNYIQDKTEFQRHIATHDRIVSPTCPFCGLMADKKFLEHVLSHSGTTEFSVHNTMAEVRITSEDIAHNTTDESDLSFTDDVDDDGFESCSSDDIEENEGTEQSAMVAIENLESGTIQSLDEAYHSKTDTSTDNNTDSDDDRIAVTMDTSNTTDCFSVKKNAIPQHNKSNPINGEDDSKFKDKNSNVVFFEKEVTSEEASIANILESSSHRCYKCDISFLSFKELDYHNISHRKRPRESSVKNTGTQNELETQAEDITMQTNASPLKKKPRLTDVRSGEEQHSVIAKSSQKSVSTSYENYTKKTVETTCEKICIDYNEERSENTKTPRKAVSIDYNEERSENTITPRKVVSIGYNEERSENTKTLRKVVSIDYNEERSENTKTPIKAVSIDYNEERSENTKTPRKVVSIGYNEERSENTKTPRKAVSIDYNEDCSENTITQRKAVSIGFNEEHSENTITPRKAVSIDYNEDCSENTITPRKAVSVDCKEERSKITKTQRKVQLPVIHSTSPNTNDKPTSSNRDEVVGDKPDSENASKDGSKKQKEVAATSENDQITSMTTTSSSGTPSSGDRKSLPASNENELTYQSIWKKAKIDRTKKLIIKKRLDSMVLSSSYNSTNVKTSEPLQANITNNKERNQRLRLDRNKSKNTKTMSLKTKYEKSFLKTQLSAKHDNNNDTKDKLQNPATNETSKRSSNNTATNETPKMSSNNPATNETPKMSSNNPATNETPKRSSNNPATNETPKRSSNNPATNETPKRSSNNPATNETPKRSSNNPATNETPKRSSNNPATNETPNRSSNNPATNETPKRSSNNPATNETSKRSSNNPATNETPKRSSNNPATNETHKMSSNNQATNETSKRSSNNQATSETPKRSSNNPNDSNAVETRVARLYSTDSSGKDSDKTKPRTDDKEKEFPCRYCVNRFFRDREKRRVHERTHTKDRRFQCDICTKKCDSRKDLETHMRVHTGEQPYVCDICGKRFSQSSNLHRHIGIHTGEYADRMSVKGFQCDLCDKSYTQKAHLVRHQMIHTGERPEKCTECEAAFMTRRDLNRHLRKHSLNKIHQCQVCNSKFTRSLEFSKHMRKHKGFENFGIFACKECGRTFRTRFDLKCHMYKHTGEQKPYVCSLCSKSFISRADIKSHMEMHERRHQCTECGKICKSTEALRSHIGANHDT